MEFYSIIRESEIMCFESKWLELENMLSKVRQAQNIWIFKLLLQCLSLIKALIIFMFNIITNKTVSRCFYTSISS